MTVEIGVLIRPQMNTMAEGLWDIKNCQHLLTMQLFPARENGGIALVEAVIPYGESYVIVQIQGLDTPAYDLSQEEVDALYPTILTKLKEHNIPTPSRVCSNVSWKKKSVEYTIPQ